MQQILKITKKNIELVALSGILILFSILSCILNGNILRDSFLFGVYQICCIMIPGAGIMLLLRIKELTYNEFLVFSYIMGYVLNIVCYYLTVPFNISWMMYPLFFCLFVVSVISIYKNRDLVNSYKRNRIDFIVCLVLFFLLLICNYFTICCYNLLPNLISENGYSKDNMFWIGISQALKRQYQPYDFRYYGKILYYHFGSSMQIAVESYVTGIEIPTLSIVFSYFQPAFMFIFASYSLFKRCIKKRFLCVLVIIFVLWGNGICNFGRGEERFCFAPLGYDTSLAILCCLIIMMMIQYKKREISKGIYISSLLFFAVMDLLKFTQGTVFLLFIGLVCLGLLFSKRWYQAFIYGIPFLVIYLVLYFGVINMKTYTDIDSYNNIVVTGEIEKSITITGDNQIQYWYSYLNEQSENIVYNIFINVVFIFIYMIGYSPFILSSFIILFYIKTFVLKKVTYLDWCILLTVLGGTILSMYLNTMSNSFFIFSASFFAIVFNLKFLQYLYDEKYLSKFIKLLIYMFTIYCVALGIKNNGIFSNQLYRGFLNRVTGVNPNLYGIEYENVVEIGDYDAYQWTKNNTATDAVIINNKNMFKENDTGRPIYVAGIFCNRYMFYSDDVVDLFKNYNYSVIEQLVQNNVNYIVCDKETSPLFNLPDEYGVSVYSSDTTEIYMLFDI